MNDHHTDLASCWSLQTVQTNRSEVTETSTESIVATVEASPPSFGRATCTNEGVNKGI